MKKLAHFILTACVDARPRLDALDRRAQAKGKTAELKRTRRPADGAPKEEEEKPEDFVVKLEKEKWQALDLDKAEPEKTELKPQRIAFGRVLDPTPLVTLDGELGAADAALAASRAEYDRTAEAARRRREHSRAKSLETAEAQFRADEIKARMASAAARCSNGARSFPRSTRRSGASSSSRSCVANSALIRVDILPGDAITDQPKSARAARDGPRAAARRDARTSRPPPTWTRRRRRKASSCAWTKPPFPLRPGMALTAWLELPAKSRAPVSQSRAPRCCGTTVARGCMCRKRRKNSCANP